MDRTVAAFWPVQHTTFYAEPTRLANAGYLSEEQERGGRKRKLYALTEAGRDVLRGWLQDPHVAPPQVRDEGLLKIFAGADPEPILTAMRSWHLGQVAELERRRDTERSVARAGARPRARDGALRTIALSLACHQQVLAVLDAHREQAGVAAEQLSLFDAG